MPSEQQIHDQIQTRALNAMDDLRAYLDVQSPTSAQTIAVVKLLCRVVLGMLRVRFGRLDASD